LPTIIFSQFAGTSLWFAANAVLPELQRDWGLSQESLGHITTAVQLGFIAGTLAFAVFTVSDRYSPRNIFLACSVLGGLANAAAYWSGHSLVALLGLRFATGFFLAGIYPVGMKIAASWYQRDLGMALGFLVGATVLGTAFPHLLRGLGQTLPWQSVLLAVSLLALVGGAAMFALVLASQDDDRIHLTVIFDVHREGSGELCEAWVECVWDRNDDEPTTCRSGATTDGRSMLQRAAALRCHAGATFSADTR
jgi:MFS family permease